jgi:hypothetical protein
MARHLGIGEQLRGFFGRGKGGENPPKTYGERPFKPVDFKFLASTFSDPETFSDELIKDVQRLYKDNKEKAIALGVFGTKGFNDLQAVGKEADTLIRDYANNSFKQELYDAVEAKIANFNTQSKDFEEVVLGEVPTQDFTRAEAKERLAGIIAREREVKVIIPSGWKKEDKKGKGSRIFADTTGESRETEKASETFENMEGKQRIMSSEEMAAVFTPPTQEMLKDFQVGSPGLQEELLLTEVAPPEEETPTLKKPVKARRIKKIKVKAETQTTSATVPKEKKPKPEPKPETLGAVEVPDSVPVSPPLEAGGVDVTARERREERAEKFAEKFGITAERNTMLSAEEEYKQAIKDLKSKSIRLPFRKIPEDIQKKYNDSRVVWRDAINHSVENQGTQREKLESKIIGFRDIVMRAEEARIQATLEASSERDQKTFVKVLNWVSRGPQALLKGLGAVSEKLGKGGASLHEKTFSLLGKESADREVLAQRYARASRIVGSAALATALFGGFGGAGVGLSVLLRVARGTLGTTLGALTGYAAGKFYKEGIKTEWIKIKGAGEKRHATVRKNKRNLSKYDDLSKDSVLEDIDFDYRRGNTEARAKQQKVVEIIGAILGGAGVSGLSGEAIQHFSASSAVQNAQETLDKVSADKQPPAAAKVESAPAPTKEITNTGERTLTADAPKTVDLTDVNKASSSYTIEESPKAEAPVRTIKPAVEAGVKTPEVIAPISPISQTYPEGLMAGGVVDVPGEGTDSAFRDLQKQFNSNFPDGYKDPSPALKHLLETNPHTLSREMGEVVYGQNGMITQMGDKFFIDEKENVWFQRIGEEPKILIENNPAVPNGYVIHDLKTGEILEGKVIADAPSSPKTTEPTQTPKGSTPSPASEDQSAAKAGTSEGTDKPASKGWVPVETVVDAEEARTATTLPQTPTARPVAGALTAEQATAQLTNTGGRGIETIEDFSARNATEGGPRSTMSAEQAIAQLQEGTAEPFTNTHGIEISPNTTSAYTWDVPGTDSDYKIAYGGTSQEASDFAKKYVTENPPAIMFFVETKVDTITGVETKVLEAWSSNSAGKVEPVLDGFVLDSKTGVPVPLPDPKDFTGKLPT